MDETQAPVVADSAGHTMIDPEPLPVPANLSRPVCEERQEGLQNDSVDR